MRAGGPLTRFDDRLETMLARDLSNTAAAAATWTQVADLLAQDGQNLPHPTAARALAALAVLRHRVPVSARAATVRGLAGRCSFIPLVVLLASEPAQIVAPLFDRLRLGDEAWLAILPAIGPLARSRLRQRSDLSAIVCRALESFGSTDFSLAGAVHDAESLRPVDAAPAETAEQASDIAQLVHRIETWRQRRPDEAAPAAVDSSRPISFLSDPDGLVRALNGLPRAAFIGISLARVAEPGDVGVDAGVARAFDKRAPIRQGRMALAPGSPWSGVWAIDAQPLFDAKTGRFTGYRGTLALADEPSLQRSETVEAHNPDTIRQMLHELRSPLNAMSGFAQLIDGQYFGPVPSAYRTLNRAILRDATRLGTGIDDLALSAELDTGSYHVDTGETLAADALSQFAQRHDDVALDPVDARAFLPVSAPQLAALLDRVRRALDPEEISPVAITLLADHASHGWRIVFTPDSSLTVATSDATRSAARLLAERLASCHGARIQFIDRSAILNFPNAMSRMEAAV